MKKFNELADSNGTSVKTYVEMMQEKAADHGWLTVNVFFNPDAKGDDRFHFASNIENFDELLMLAAAYAAKAQQLPAPPNKEIGVVKPA